MGDKPSSVVRINERVQLIFSIDALPTQTENVEYHENEWNGIRYWEVHEPEKIPSKASPLRKAKLSPLAKPSTSGSFFALRRQIQEVERSITDLEEQERRNRIVRAILEKVPLVV